MSDDDRMSTSDYGKEMSQGMRAGDYGGTGSLLWQQKCKEMEEALAAERKKKMEGKKTSHRKGMYCV